MTDDRPARYSLLSICTERRLGPERLACKRVLPRGTSPAHLAHGDTKSSWLDHIGQWAHDLAEPMREVNGKGPCP